MFKSSNSNYYMHKQHDHTSLLVISRVMRGPIEEVYLVKVMIEIKCALLARLHLVATNNMCPPSATDVCSPCLVGKQNSEASSGHRHLGHGDHK